MDYVWYNEISKTFLDRDYLVGQTLKQRLDVISAEFERRIGIPGMGAKLHSYIAKGWISLSSPIWSNFGTTRGLPISCFGSYIDDTMESILYANAEIGIMSKIGGGTSAYFGNLRHRGAEIKGNGTSSGSVHFMQLFETTVNLISQGSTRRGSFAGYLPIEHPDIDEFLTIKSDASPLQKMHFGVTVTDRFLREMRDGDVAKRTRWAKVLSARSEHGQPYILFIDNANRGRPDVYKDLGLEIVASNLCTEIMLPSSPTESFVCDLASANILHFDEWKNTDLIEVITMLLDCVMSEFIEKASKIPFMERAVRFAERHRALGLGWLGWHSYLQSKMVPWESMEAKRLNVLVAKTIYEQAYAASAKLAQMFGEPELLKGYGRRNTTLIAIAPTKSSSIILGQVSQGIEPFLANYYLEDVAKGKFLIKNPELEKLFIKKGKNIQQVWDGILAQGGSVQHLEFLDENEKAVFKTFEEISQKEIVIQAAARQRYIDQGQSLNLRIPPSVPVKDINSLMLFAWENGIKSLYYQKSKNAAQAFANILECRSCEA